MEDVTETNNLKDQESGLLEEAESRDPVIKPAYGGSSSVLSVGDATQITLLSGDESEEEENLSEGSEESQGEDAEQFLPAEEVPSVEEPEVGDSDKRVGFIHMYLNGAFRVKKERWLKMLMSESHRKLIFNFLDSPEVQRLYFTNPAYGYVRPVPEFPANKKTKFVYFIKRSPEIITEQNMYDLIMFADVAPNPIDDLGVLLDKIFVPLSCGKQKEEWPASAMDTIKRKTLEMRDRVYRVREEMKKQKMLVIPEEINGVFDIEAGLGEKPPKPINVKLRIIYEQAVLAWSTYLQEGILSLKSTDVDGGDRNKYPLPSSEYQFWDERVKNLESIYQQLKDPKVQCMARILEATQSMFIPCFKEMLGGVMEALNEARDMEKYLYPLKVRTEALQSTPFESTRDHYYPLLYTLGMIWVNCPGFNSDNVKFFHITKLICNMFVLEGYRAMDPPSIFHGDVDDNLPKINKVIANMKLFRTMLEEFDPELREIFPDKSKAIIWLYYPHEMFDRYDKNLLRLQELQHVLREWSEYNKLEKITVGGFYAEHLSQRLDQLALDFEDLLNHFRNVSYDPGDIDDPSWDEDYEMFKQKLNELDNKLAAVASLTFDDCTNFESIFKMMYLFQPFLEKEFVKKSVEPKYDKIAESFKGEVINVYKIFNDQMTKVKETGLFDCPIMWPPVAGSLLWLRNIRKRIAYPLENVSNFKHECCDTDDVNLSKEKAHDLITKAAGDELEIFEKWSSRVASEIKWNMRKTVLNASNAKILSINFDKKLTAALRELRYLKFLEYENFPPEAQELFARSEELHEWNMALHKAVGWYNYLRQKTKVQEFDIIQDEVSRIDDIATDLTVRNNWNSENNWEAIVHLRDEVWTIFDRMTKAQDNLDRIIRLINQWNDKPLFDRPRGRREQLLVHSDVQAVNQRYDDIIKAGEIIYDLIERNFRFLHALPVKVLEIAGLDEEGEEEGEIGTVVATLLEGEDEEDAEKKPDKSKKRASQAPAEGMTEESQPTVVAEDSQADEIESESDEFQKKQTMTEGRPSKTPQRGSSARIPDKRKRGASEGEVEESDGGEEEGKKAESAMQPEGIPDLLDIDELGDEEEEEEEEEEEDEEEETLEAESTDILLIERPYQRAYYLTELWKSERLGGHRPKYEDYAHLQPSMVEEAAKAYRKKDSTFVAEKGKKGKEKPEKKKEKDDKKKKESKAKEKEGGEGKGIKKKVAEEKRKSKESEPSKGKGGEAEKEEKKKGKKQEGAKETPKVEDISGEKKDALKETKKEDKQKRLSVISDIGDIGGEQTQVTEAMGLEDDLPKEEEKVEEHPEEPEPTDEELYAKLMEEFAKNPDKIDRWDRYLDMVDDYVSEGLLKTVDTSIDLFVREMANDPRLSPLFELVMKLKEPDIEFEPSLDLDENNRKSLIGLYNVIEKDLNSQALLVPRISYTRRERTYMDDVLKDANIEKKESDTKQKFLAAINNTKQWAQKFYAYEFLWKESRVEHLRQFLKYNRLLTPEEIAIERKMIEDPTIQGPTQERPQLQDFKQKIDFYEGVHTELDKMQMSDVIDNWLRIDMSLFKVALLTHCTKWSQLYKMHLINEVNDKLRSMDKFIVETMGSFEKPIIHGDYDGLVAIIGARMKVQEKAPDADTMFDQLAGTIRLLKEYGISFPMEIHFLLKVLPNKWKNVKNVAVSVRENVAPLLAEEADLIKKRMDFFDIRAKLFMRAFKKKRFYNWDCWEPYLEIDNCEKEVADFEDKCAKLIDQAYLFEVPVPEFTILKSFRKELKMVKMMWDYIHVVLTIVEDWERTPWKKIDSEVMDIELKKFTKELRGLDRDMRDWDLYKKLESTIKNMMTALRAIAELQNPAMRDRHWQQLMEATKVKFVILDTTTLKELLDLNLYKYEEEVKNIVDKSVKENIFEKILGELKVTWSQMEFAYETHPRTGCKVLKVSEESVEVLEENQVQLQNMLNSKFVSYFLEEVTDWQKKLSTADIVISSWVDVQRTWLYLESIFIGSEDIRRQLPEESRLFDRIDKEIRSILQEMAVTPNIVKATNRPFLQERIEGLRTDLTKCEKALSEYLETKRLAYPRFYFVSSADLLDILSNGNQPELVCRHLTKLYDSMAKLKFKQEGGKNTKLGIGFWAKDGEFVSTTGVCNCSGQVEKWLNNVTDIMRRTLRNIFNHAHKTYNDKAREVWIFDYPAQIALVGTQIYWSVEVEVAFSKIEEGYDTAMKEYQKKQIAQLNALINLMLGELSDADRQKVTTICTIDVHSRDVVAKMITMKIEDVHAFQWQSQLRHRWDSKLFDVYVNICDAQFKYDYEYLGNTPRLVITPLTDRCYITLTQSLHLIMGGAPAGPAGTGKTETTKDLGKGLGMMVYVFNCSEQMDYKSCGNIYKGLAQTGAWGCFDEFNRISVEVLSVVALQVKTVLDAIKAKKTTFNFIGEIIALVPTVGMFITMNPGYAGRAELPENLKALFRPCAMVVPDFELICENMLIGEAFQEARILGKKFLTLYSLCKELLSKQDHYDWGLRAIKSVLVVAGKLRRGDKNRPEDQVLMRALRDFNVPKIVTADVPVFMGLIGDLFPGLDVPRKRELDFEKLVKIAAVDMGLQPEDNFILKVVQLVELFAVRHSVFIIGFAGTGKSCVWKCLYRTYLNMKKRPHYNDLEPKAVTNDELFGIINPQTREWKDGLFSVLIREQANMTGDGPKWMVLDGDIDPMWIESLNTVMDDNKVLTLASNERIALTAHMRLLFEISNLRTATPATVSRAGILYINPTDLGWRPYVTSWLDSRLNENEKSTLNDLFEKYVPTILEASTTTWKRITPIPEIAHIHMQCSLLEVLLVSANVPADCPTEWYEIYFVFASIWAFGSATFKAQLVDWRMEFTTWWVRQFKTVTFPAAVMNGEGTVFDYYVGQEDKSWLLWTDKLTDFELDPENPLQSTLVNTAETTRVRFFLDMLIDQKKPVMLIAPAGSGKSVLLYDKLSNLSEKYGVTNIPFNFYTTSEALQKVLEKPLEKKAGRNFGPPGNKTMIYFIDDMNMPEVDKYGTVQPHTLIRQYMDYQHWYDRQKLTLKDINNILFLTCMNPAAGSFTIDSRLQRHFYVFALSFPNLEALSHIYSSILRQHMNNPSNKFAPEVAKTSDLIIDMALAMHSRMQVTFLPTAIKFHYIFSLRDLSNIFQSVILTNQECITSPIAFIRLWMHEANRIYGDRLVSLKEQAQCQSMIFDTVRKMATSYTDEEIIVKPMIFCHFAEGIGDSKYMPITSWQTLYKLLTEAMGQYNELVSTMQLVLFEDAMSHICRINRVMEMPRGNAMLVGVGGSGKQSLSRLSAFICGLDPFQIQLRKGYSVTDMKTDLNVIYNKAGMKNMGIMFLMTDAQVPEERFLTPINDMLASGDVPELFADDEVEGIINAVAPEVKSAGLPDTREAAWKFFIDRVRKNLKTMLCFSPVGSTLRVRARKFPALVNCTTIDWFMEWPKSALESVSYRFLGDIRQVPSNLKNPISLCMAQFHLSVNQMSHTYLLNEKRYCYTTPKSFLELISLYGKMLHSKFKENKDKIYKLQNGLQKLVSCAEEATVLKSKLGEQQKIVAEKNKVAGELVKLVGTEAEKVSKEKVIAQEEERKSQIMEVEVSIKQKVCEEDLLKAMPALEAAQAALNTLNKDNLTELKTFVSPAPGVARVAEAVLVLLSKKGKVPKDRSWKACKAVMGSADAFLQTLVNYNKENIPDTAVKAIQEYITHPEFTPENVITKSSAAAGLCAWVINIMRFHEVWMVVLPKKKAEAAARTELMRTKEKLAELMDKINKLESELAILTRRFEQAVAEKDQCQKDEERMIEAIDLANRLINGLSSENARWKETVITLTKQLETFPGDLLLVSSFVSYQGGFSRKYRVDLMEKHWKPSINSFDNPKIPMSGNIDPLEMLADESQIAMWQNEGLPNDRMSSENAAILTNCARWPLMIDPQLQGIKWVKNKYGSALKVLRLGAKNYLDQIENAVAIGTTILFENIGETVDPVLDNLLGRNLVKKGKVLVIGDREIDFHKDFRLILHTKLGNPHYQPEIQAQTTLINFTVTRDGLEEQFLAEVVKAERPDLERLMSNLTKQMNSYKITLKALEDELLVRLSNAGPDILQDRVLVEKLETTKKTAEHISVKMTEARSTSAKINIAREVYRPVAERSSLLYFIMNDLQKIKPIYQFSLKAFNIVFHHAVHHADSADTVALRVEILTENITYEYFMYTSRALFEEDKMNFMSIMALQIQAKVGDVTPKELDFLLRYPYVPNLNSPIEFLSNTQWGGIKALSQMEEFKNLDKDVEGAIKRWKAFVDGDNPERERFPLDWKNKSAFQKLCMMRALRPDRMVYAMRYYIEQKLGSHFTSARTVEFDKSFEETSSTIPVFFILSPGVDPTRDVERVGKKIGFGVDKKNFHNVSLGQGQELVAERAIETGSKLGHWVILQNIHLVARWLPTLDKRMEAAYVKPHHNFRLFISAEPAPSPEFHCIPQGVLENAIKITNEAPTGMQANLHKALDNFNQDTLEMCSKEAEFKAILFSLCYFHAVVAERRKFGPQGWNRTYPFNVGDLTISVHVLYNYLENNQTIPWEDLRYLFGEIMYGGHITDDWDRRLCRTYLKEYMSSELVEGDLFYCPGFQAPPNTDYAGYHKYIDAMLPPESPILYGLHPNAEYNFLITQAERLFKTIFELQPRETGAAEGKGISREDKVTSIIANVMSRMTDGFDIEGMMNRTTDRSPFTIVAFQECERMNILMNEMRRTLRELSLGLKGELTITNEMELLEESLFMDQVPASWMARAYPSQLPLSAWSADLHLRIQVLQSWIVDFTLPATIWLGGLFNPQSFLTAIMQTTARKNEWPLDKMCLQCDVSKKGAEEFTMAPREGAYLGLLYMEGARWDVNTGSIVESKPKELYPIMPVIHCKAITIDKQDTRNIYDCPVYKTKMRGPTFVWTFNLKTRVKSSKWILAGVGILLSN